MGCSFNWTGCSATNAVIGVRILYGLPNVDLKGGAVSLREENNETVGDEIIEKLDGIVRRLDELIRLFKLQRTGEAQIMATLDEVLTDVAAESTQIDSLSTLTAGLKQQLADALAGTTLPPATQAKIDAVFAGVEANKAKVVTAINTNTAAAAVPVVPAPAPAV